MAAIPNPYAELFREPNLLIPGKKPVGSVKIDWENRFASGLRNLQYANKGSAFQTLGVGKPDWQVVGSPIVNVSSGQQGIQLDGSGGVYTHRLHEDASGPVGDWTLFMQCVLNETSGTSDRFFGFCETPTVAASDRSIALNNGNWAGYVYDGIYAETDIPQTIGELVTVAVSCTSSSIICGIRAGGITTTASAATTSTGYGSYSSVELSLGRANNFAAEKMTVFVAGYSNIAWSEVEILDWVADPYQFLIPA